MRVGPPVPTVRLQGFQGLDATFDPGSCTIITGPNGSGKTSLLRALLGLQTPIPHSTKAHAGILVFQDPLDGLTGLSVAGEARMRVVGLPSSLRHLQHRDVATLSSGEARFVALQLGRGELVCFDEPAEGLDHPHLQAFCQHVQELQESGSVVIIADHTGRLSHLGHDLSLGTSAFSNTAMPEPPAGPSLKFKAQTIARHLDCPLPALEFSPGFHVITGPNGAGKSTLILALAGLLGVGATFAGQPLRLGTDCRLLLSDASRLQFGHLAAHPEWHPGRAGQPHTMSEGEAQRAALGRILQPAKVWLLDEPDRFLDDDGRTRLLQDIATAVAAGTIVVAATHDQACIAAAHTRVEL